MNFEIFPRAFTMIFMAVKKLPYEKYKEIYSLVPRLVVEVIVKTPEGIILTRRAIEPYRGLWHLPGGTVMFGERLEEAVKRVAEDEINLNVEITKFLGYIEYTSEIKNGGFGWTVGLAFLVYVIGGKLENGNQSSEVCVFKELPKDMIKEQSTFIHEKLEI